MFHNRLFELCKIISIEVIAKPLEARAYHPQILEKSGRDARVPGKTSGFAISSIVLFLTIVLFPVATIGQEVKLTGRVLAVSSWPVTSSIILRGFPSTQEFIFGVESKDPHGNEKFVPVYVCYEYYPDSDKLLQEDFFDYSKKYELSLIRAQAIGRGNQKENLDFFLEEVAYVKSNIRDEDGNLLRTYIDKQFSRLKILDGVPESILNMDMDIVLPFYKLSSIKYKTIKEKLKK